METIYSILEFDQIQQILKSYASSSLAKDAIDQFKMIDDLTELQETLNYTDEGLKLLYAHGDMPMGGFYDVEAILHQCEVDGIASIEQLLKIESHVHVTKQIELYMKVIKVPVPRITEKFQQIEILNDLQQAINRCIDDRAEMKDEASTQLMLLRKEHRLAEKTVRQRLERFMNIQRDHIAESFITERNGRFVIPVKSSSKNIIKGMIHGESASGQTTYLEPSEVVEVNNQLHSLINKINKEIEKILYDLSQKVKLYVDVIRHNVEIIESFDVVFAKAKYAKAMHATIPTITKEVETLSFKKARHPLIDPKKVVANDIEISLPHHMMLITGSNTGGKTVTLKTIGLLSMMALCGLAVPSSRSVVPHFEHLFVDLGDGQSIAESLSTFSSHMKRLISITQQVNSRSLVLLDELGSGTDPKDGENIAIALLDYLKDKQALVVATTHYAKLKTYAREHDDVLGASVAFDVQSLQPTYQLLINQLGQSYALEIAQKLGLNQAIIQHARELKEASKDMQDRLLEQLEIELEDNRLLKQELEALQQSIIEKEEYLSDQMESLERRKQATIEAAKLEANRMVEQVKLDAYKVIEEIKQRNVMLAHEQNEVMGALDDLMIENEKEVGDINHVYHVGDQVKVISLQKEGEVVQVLNNKVIEVSMGGLKTRLKTKDIVYLGKAKTKPKVKNTKVVRPTVKMELNLIGLRVEEAMEEMDRYMDQAVFARLPQVRIIHGHGTGALREAVAQRLKRNSHVESYRLGDGHEGGVGATVVILK